MSPIDGIVGNDAAVPSRDVDELRMAGNVPRCEDARVCRAKFVINDNFASTTHRNSDQVEAEVACAGSTTRCDKHRFRTNFFVVRARVK